MGIDGRDRRHTTDESGNTWLVDVEGRFVTDASGNRIPGPAEELTTPGGFRHYDSSRGHCGLCGRLTCNGTCFK
jgi:hypothetical protein